ncbi:MAG TPA: non-canonical purine NTP pyrophosphatase [Candidatus Saccharimonadales bacterium]|nr:non-canonical purine NTP pyrophosphatase [Candidatus Saccharimonadales bacterium]
MFDMKELAFITSHPKKAEELSRYLNYPVTHHKLDLPEIQSLDPHEVVGIKAKEAYRQLEQPVLVEDFSLRFEVLGRLPGTLIKWFLTELRPEGLCRLLDSYDRRDAIAQTCFAFCDQNGLHIFDGVIEGTIAASVRGEQGYGTDSIFIPAGQSKTWSEMDEQEQVKYSLRRIGLEKLRRFLTQWEPNSK